jgi:hypothetical protein
VKETNVEVTAAEEQQEQQPGEGDGEEEGGQQGGTLSLVLLWLPFSDFTCPLNGHPLHLNMT